MRSNIITEKMAWNAAIAGGATPPPRSRHTANLVNNKLYIIGGGDEGRVYNDVHILDIGVRQQQQR